MKVNWNIIFKIVKVLHVVGIILVFFSFVAIFYIGLEINFTDINYSEAVKYGLEHLIPATVGVLFMML